MSVIRHYVMELKRYLRHKCFHHLLIIATKWYFDLRLFVCLFVCALVYLRFLYLMCVCIIIILCMIKVMMMIIQSYVETEENSWLIRSNGFNPTHWSGQLINNLPNDNVHSSKNKISYSFSYLFCFPTKNW